jgi:hypothetical protein
MDARDKIILVLAASEIGVVIDAGNLDEADQARLEVVVEMIKTTTADRTEDAS